MAPPVKVVVAEAVVAEEVPGEAEVVPMTGTAKLAKRMFFSPYFQ